MNPPAGRLCAEWRAFFLRAHALAELYKESDPALSAKHRRVACWFLALAVAAARRSGTVK